MKTHLSLIVSLFAACALLWAGDAEARFGKASDPKDAKASKQSKSNEKKSGSASGSSASKSEHRAEKRSQPRAHAASAVPVRGAHAAGPVYAASEPCCGHRPVVVRSRTYVSSGAHVHSHHDDGHGSGPELQRFELMAGAQPALGAGILSAGMLADWSSWGFDTRVDHLVFLPEEWGSPMDTVTLFDASITRAIVSGEKGRLRGHLGLSSAFAPDATFLGPYGGLSASAKILGPLTFDAAANLTLFPFTKVDTRAGLGLRLGVVEVRGGMRLLAINDQGRVDGVSNSELFVGPYASAGLVF